jgi:pSer/pThr/pTyr-binding forkhead associated (FHA) protein
MAKLGDEWNETRIGRPSAPGPQLRATGRLTVKTSPADHLVGSSIELRGADTAIGRTRENHLVLMEDGDVSRYHAKIERKDGLDWIVDLNSSNGTWVNGDRVKEPRALRKGDTILVGSTTINYDPLP